MTGRPIIALLTDFGAVDWFVGSMTAAILTRCPDGTVVHLCHNIHPGAIHQAAWVLQKTFRDFPPRTVFCAVVDPGVGSERRALAAAADEHFFVAPDNGLLTGVRRQTRHWRCRQITNPRWMQPRMSQTFHGRDLFAPAAGQIALTGDIAEAGDTLSDPIEIAVPGATAAPDGTIEGTVVWFDRFGNAITTIERERVCAGDPARSPTVALEHLTIAGVSSTYADVARGEPVAYWGSLETLEIAVREGSARERFNLEIGQSVRVLPA